MTLPDLPTVVAWLHVAFPTEEGRILLAFLLGACSMGAVLGIRR